MFLKKLKNKKIQNQLKRVNIYHTKPERIIGKLTVEESTSLNNLRIINNCSIGFLTYFGANCEIRNCEIGRYCSIGRDITIGLYNHPIDHFTTHPLVFGGPIRLFKHTEYNKLKMSIPHRGTTKVKIGHDVWIGHHAVIKSGITIGTGTIIGTGSVVTKDIPPYSIVAGNPAKLIKYRFDESLRTRLLQSEWWNYDLADILPKLNDNEDENEGLLFIKTLAMIKDKKRLNIKKHSLSFDTNKHCIQIN